MVKHYLLLGIDKNDGTAKYIDEVPNGKNCGCICAECKGELIAKNNGKVKIHHFAHASGNDSIKCSQTALHRLAKKLYVEEKLIPIPKKNNVVFHSFDSIEEEKYMEDITPDLYAIIDGRPFIVEIYVTHEVNEDKKQKIVNHHVSTVEVDLSEKKLLSKNDVKKELMNPANIKIIYDDDVSLVSERKDFLLRFGLKIKVQPGGVVRCPYAKNIVTANFCRDCVLCCDSNDGFIRCGAMVSMLINPDLPIRNETKIVVNKCEVMFSTEAESYNKSHFGWKMRTAVEHAYMSRMFLR